MDAHVPCSISGLFWGTPERPLPALSSQQSWSSPKRGEPGQKHLLSLKSREWLQSFEQQPVKHGAVASSLLPSWENPEQTLPTCWNRPRSSTPEQKQSHCQTQLVTNIITFSFVLRKLLGNVGVLQQWQSLVCLGFFFFPGFFIFFSFFLPFSNKTLSIWAFPHPSLCRLLAMAVPRALGSLCRSWLCFPPRSPSCASIRYLPPHSPAAERCLHPTGVFPCCQQVLWSPSAFPPPSQSDSNAAPVYLSGDFWKVGQTSLAQNNGQTHAGMLLAGAGSTACSLGPDATQRRALLVQIPSSKQRDHLGKLRLKCSITVDPRLNSISPVQSGSSYITVKTRTQKAPNFFCLLGCHFHPCCRSGEIHPRDVAGQHAAPLPAWGRQAGQRDAQPCRSLMDTAATPLRAQLVTQHLYKENSVQSLPCCAGTSRGSGICCLCMGQGLGWGAMSPELFVLLKEMTGVTDGDLSHNSAPVPGAWPDPAG